MRIVRRCSLKNFLKPEKLGDSGKFLIPCDFPRMDIGHALADLGANINLMPFSIWKKLSLPELTPTRKTLELADRSITRPKGVVEDVFVKVGKFHFPTDFVVVDFDADPRVPLILGRSFLRTSQITLQVNDEAVTFNLNQTTRYSSTYDDMSVNRIDVIDVYIRNPCLSLNLFSSNDDFFLDFTSSDDESLFDEDVLEDNVKIYSNPLFAYDDEYISSDVNPLFDEVLEDIESKDSYVSNLDEPALLVTPLSDANEDECFDPGGVIDEIDAFLDMDISTDIENGDHDSEGDIIYLESLLIDDTIPNLPPKVFLDHDPRSLKDEPDNDDLMTKDKVFNLRI
ncbi:reverse transcriptase domain-containing protein [Tanacetum coccineum]